ncbi:unnamed protein product [Alopecurus aequalis]
MQRAAARAASLAIRHFASSASRPTAAASLLPGTAVLNAGTRLSAQPTAAPAALCSQRGYASGARKTKAAASDEEKEDDEVENMGSDEEFDGDFDDPYDGWPICKPIGESSDDEWVLNDPKNKWN